MCGIAALINYHDLEIPPILQSLNHRGPDAFNVWKYSNVALLHTRLAIQDIANGAQPFTHNHLTITFNGEIYNHLSLRNLLSDYTFTTQSDTETLLYLYDKYGIKMFDYLDGMFAFVIHNMSDNTLFVARDRAGKKPLYLYQDANRIMLASELNAIRSIIPLTINEEVIASYLRCGFLFNTYTPYNNITEIPAGHWAVYSTATHCLLSSHSYFNYGNTSLSRITNLNQAINHLDELLNQSIKSRLLSSDVEVGAFLSGGIDSNLITGIAKQYQSKLRTFTVQFDGKNDESLLAAQAANYYGTQHTTLRVHYDLKNDLQKILSLYGEPFMDSSCIPSYYVSKEASNYVKVVLNGDGADELFAGYRRYVPFFYNITSIIGLFSPLLRVLPKPKYKSSFYHYLHRLISMGHKRDLDLYLSSTTDVFEDFISFPSNQIFRNMTCEIKKVLHQSEAPILDRLLTLDFNLLLFSDLLVKMDIATMANGIEGRSPFLSKDILAFSSQLSPSLKIKWGKTKFILRHLAKRYVPSFIVNQPKRGFEVPLVEWVNKDLATFIQDALSVGCYSETFVSREFIQGLIQNKIPCSTFKRSKMLWSLLCLEVWYQSCARYPLALGVNYVSTNNQAIA